MKEYYIACEPVTINDRVMAKYNIYYYHNNIVVGKEFHSTDGINGIIKQGYKLKTK